MARVMIEVDERGRASLAKLGFKNTQLVAEELEAGVFTIQPAVILTKLEAAHYDDPGAMAALVRARASQKEGRVSKGKLRSQNNT